MATIGELAENILNWMKEEKNGKKITMESIAAKFKEYAPSSLSKAVKILIQKFQIQVESVFRELKVERNLLNVEVKYYYI